MIPVFFHIFLSRIWQYQLIRNHLDFCLRFCKVDTCLRLHTGYTIIMVLSVLDNILIWRLGLLLFLCRCSQNSYNPAKCGSKLCFPSITQTLSQLTMTVLYHVPQPLLLLLISFGSGFGVSEQCASENVSSEIWQNKHIQQTWHSYIDWTKD